MKRNTSATAAKRYDDDGVDDDGDVTLVDESINDEEPQDENVRRQLRNSIRNIQLHASRNRNGLISGDADELQKTLGDADEIFKDVKHCREAVIDAQLMNSISQMGKEKVQSFATSLTRFNSIQFAEKLVSFVGGNMAAVEGEPHRISRDGWLALGKGCAQYFKHSPSLHFMFGSFSRDPPEERKRREKVAAGKDKDNLRAPVAPRQVLSLQGMEKKEATTIEVERIYGILRNLYRKKGNQPICYFEFVTNPDSFSQTVENMFHTSFLIRDGHCQIKLDADRLPTIEPVDRQDDEQPVNELPHQQVITHITMEEWQNIVRTFEIERPLIKTRERIKPSGSSSQPSSSYATSTAES